MGLKKKQTFPELSQNEKKLLERIVEKDVTVEEIRVLLQEKDVKVDCLDDCGMTPLQHAAFRNKYDIAELLLSHGADVNSNFHENDYSALMFAALSGSPQMTRLMLAHGAKKDKVNSVNRNAAQMAAFVGQHQCVAVINNFYAKEDLEYFTVPHGLETEPKLPPMVLPAVLKLLNFSNMHPVKVCLHLLAHPEMMNESYKVCKVFDMICERAMKSRDTDDITAMKAHYFATVIRKSKDFKDLTAMIKRLLKGRDTDGYPEFQDQLIRQALKEFPYVESQLLQTMVRQLSATKIGDSPTSLNILMQGVNGQKFGFDHEEDCATCGEAKAVRKCSACKMVYYCGPECQKFHWFTHKKFCPQLAKEFVELEKERERVRIENEERERKEKEEKEAAELAKKMAEADVSETTEPEHTKTSQVESPSTTENSSSTAAETSALTLNGSSEPAPTVDTVEE